MVVLRRTHLAYPNDWHLARLHTQSGRVGLAVVDDQRRRFALPLPDKEATERFVSSLYLPGVDPARHQKAVTRAGLWTGTTIGIPLRRLTLRPDDRPSEPAR